MSHYGRRTALFWECPDQWCTFRSEIGHLDLTGEVLVCNKDTSDFTLNIAGSCDSVHHCRPLQLEIQPWPTHKEKETKRQKKQKKKKRKKEKEKKTNTSKDKWSFHRPNPNDITLTVSHITRESCFWMRNENVTIWEWHSSLTLNASYTNSGINNILKKFTDSCHTLH